MKKMQSYRIDVETIKQIDEIGEIEKRTKSNVIEIAVEKYYQELRGENKMYNVDQVIEFVGAKNEQELISEYRGKTVEEILSSLIEMFGYEGKDINLAESIYKLVN